MQYLQKNLQTALILFSIFLTGLPIQAKGKSVKNKMSFEERMREQSNKRLDVGLEVPPEVEKRKWKISGKINGQLVFPTTVPLYYYDGLNVKLIPETLAVGTPVVLDKVMSVNMRHFYGFRKDLKTEQGQTIERIVWIDGMLVERDE